MSLLYRNALYVLTALALFWFIPCSAILHAEEPKPMLVRAGLVRAPASMTSEWLLGQIEQARQKRMERYEELKTVCQIEKWQKERKEFFWERLGPMWEKTPLNVRVAGKLDKGAYRVEKLVFESLPNFYVTATLFLPPKDRFPNARPGVLHVCGHSEDGKAMQKYQRAAILGAINGLVVLSMDPIEQGERIMNCEGGKPFQTSSRRHDLLGPDSILTGRNAATFFVWDMIRALDCLQTRPEVDPNRLGVMGNSGGGTQTSYIMALDGRVKAAAPCCYTCSLYGKMLRTLGPQDAEQCIFGQVAFGLDHPDYSIMRAPLPTLICTTTNDYFPIEDAWQSFRQAKRIYTRFHEPGHIGIAEADGSHGYHVELREASVAWMLRLLDGRKVAVREDETMPILTGEEIRSLPEPGVSALPNAKTTHDFNRQLANDYDKTRAKDWKNLTVEKKAELVRRIAGFRSRETLPPVHEVVVPGAPNEFVLRTEPGIFLPLRFNRLPKRGERIELILSDGGTRSKRNVTEMAASDKCLVVVDLRGTGETRPVKHTYHYDQAFFGVEGYEFSLAFLLGKSFIGMRAEDLVETAVYLKGKYPDSPLSLYARENMRLVALHVAVAEQSLFDMIRFEKPETIPRFRDYVTNAPGPVPAVNLVHGVLKYYDTDDLYTACTSFFRAASPGNAVDRGH
ncbi:MAG: acetylxylan esterase [Thermoguttaceae bacterium]|nr:acetylxylan esterase [Thermoguttaceae bacterium]